MKRSRKIKVWSLNTEVNINSNVQADFKKEGFVINKKNKQTFKLKFQLNRISVYKPKSNPLR